MTPHVKPILEDEEEIARVRAVRHRISHRFEHDPYRLVAHYVERQKEHQDRFVHAPEPDAAGDATD
jgi:hypothetical protein